MKGIIFIFVFLSTFHKTQQRNLLRELLKDVLEDQQDTKTLMHTTKTVMEATTVQTKVTSYYCSGKVSLYGTTKKEHSLGKKDTMKECFHACIAKKEHDTPNINYMVYGIIGKGNDKSCYCEDGAAGEQLSTQYTGCYLRETKWDK